MLLNRSCMTRSISWTDILYGAEGVRVGPDSCNGSSTSFVTSPHGLPLRWAECPNMTLFCHDYLKFNRLFALIDSLPWDLMKTIKDIHGDFIHERNKMYKIYK